MAEENKQIEGQSFAAPVIGCTPLLLWGSMVKNIRYGGTIPPPQLSLTVLTGEVVITFVLIVMLCLFSAGRKIRAITTGSFNISLTNNKPYSNV